LYHKTRVPGLSCGAVLAVLHLAVLIQCRLVMDEQTDRQTNRQTNMQWKQILH